MVESTMKAAQIAEYNQPYELTDRPVPRIRDTELLVRVKAAGFCHSDLQVLQGRFQSPLGLIPSHEPAGVVVEIGPECRGDWKLGDRVGVLNFKTSCGACSGCRLARRARGKLDARFCEKRETAGFQSDGGLAEFIAADPEATVHLPDSLSFEQAAPLMCAGATVWGSLEKATSGLAPGDAVAIIGIGGLGHLGVQFAKAMGFRAVAVDSRPAGRQLAAEVPRGALRPDLVLDSGSETATEEVYRFTDGEGVAAAVVCTDSIAANSWALKLLRVGGTLGLLGLPAEQWRFDSDVIIFKQLTLTGTYVADKDATERMMRAVERSGVESHLTVVPFEDVPRIVDMYRDANFRGRLVVKVSD